MSALWPALIGAGSALVVAWVTQWLTNRREFQRDQLRWAQERQQRELDAQKTALVASLTALHKWHSAMTAVNLYLGDPYEHPGDTKVLPSLEMEARHSLAAVQLVCNEEVVRATVAAIKSLELMNYNLRVALDHFDYMQGAHQSSIGTDKYDRDMNRVADVYRTDLSKLGTEPVVLTQKPRKKLSHFLRRKTT
ncbi:hypothetical protein [Lentzea sp. NPDC060358]|uniref:hypothetical protein n=1 Tax=Lentzea sp. NPDC060358 TaxID=3347103 RepID=UPI003650BA3C